MNKLLLLLLMMIALSACHPNQRKLADFSFRDIKGEEHHLSDYHGKWIFINFWAAWCGACRSEVSDLNQLATADPKNLVVLGVDYDAADLVSIQADILRMGIQFPVMQENPIHQLGLEDVTVLPTTVVINPNGNWVRTMYGAQSADNLRHVTE
jgi:thiol-disulfide isomerase/thioredoxin